MDKDSIIPEKKTIKYIPKVKNINQQKKKQQKKNHKISVQKKIIPRFEEGIPPIPERLFK